MLLTFEEPPANIKVSFLHSIFHTFLKSSIIFKVPLLKNVSNGSVARGVAGVKNWGEEIKMNNLFLFLYFSNQKTY